MSSERQKNMDKERKSDAQKEYERLDNEGRFAGDDVDSRLAEREARENVKQEPTSKRQVLPPDEPDDSEANLDPNKSHSFRAEAQNVNDEREPGKLMGNDNDVEHATNKANQNRS